MLLPKNVGKESRIIILASPGDPWHISANTPTLAMATFLLRKPSVLHKILRVLFLLLFQTLPALAVSFAIAYWCFTGNAENPPTKILCLAIIVILLNTLRI
jgi:hypothetical protein